MDDIAERAGVSKPVLYQHFPSKLELYCALLDQHADDLLAKVRRALDSTTDNKARVAASVAAYFDFVDGKGSDVEGAFRLVFESDLRNDPAVRERVERMTRDCADAIAETIAHDTGYRPGGGAAALHRPDRPHGGQRPLVADLARPHPEGRGRWSSCSAWPGAGSPAPPGRSERGSPACSDRCAHGVRPGRLGTTH
jgi:AcrR family transcriptional regulator